MDFGPIPSTQGPAFGLSRTRWGLVAEMMLPEISFPSLHIIPFCSVLLQCLDVGHMKLPFAYPTCGARLRLHLVTAGSGKR
jgi:hypothetical protein